MGLSGYRLEPAVLALVALAALPVVNLAGPQDRTRYELTRRLVLQHTITIEPELFDRAVFDGKSYSDKAPGMSFLAVPPFQLERALGIAKAPVEWRQEGDLSLWLIRVLTSGVLFLVSVLLVGRLGEALVAGTGAATAAIFGVGTLAAPLAPTFFEHDAAGAAAVAAFALVWRSERRLGLLAAGFAAGAAVLLQYGTALIALVLAVWCWRQGARRLGWFALGGVPPAVALAAYDWVAFGSPFHLSYRYVANPFTERQQSGLFGIGAPSLHGLREVIAGPRGLLVVSPVLLAACVGLVLLWRRGARAPALVAGIVTLLFVLLDAGYFLPYGGNSPGPRFLAPALPFLALGLPLALSRLRLPTLALGAASAVTTTVVALTWSIRKFDDTSWLPHRTEIAKSVWVWLGPDRNAGAALVLAAALLAVALGAREALRA